MFPLGRAPYPRAGDSRRGRRRRSCRTAAGCPRAGAVTAVRIRVVHYPRGGCVGGGTAGQQAGDEDCAEQARPAGGPQSFTGHESAQQRIGSRTRDPSPKKIGQNLHEGLTGQRVPGDDEADRLRPDYPPMLSTIVLPADDLRQVFPEDTQNLSRPDRASRAGPRMPGRCTRPAGEYKIYNRPAVIPHITSRRPSQRHHR